MGHIKLDQRHEVLRHRRRAPRHQPRDRRRRVRGLRRPLGLRQVHAAAAPSPGSTGRPRGEIRIDGKDVINDVPAADRGLAMVFQSYALYPHMSVRQNLAFGLENTRMPKAEIDAAHRRGRAHARDRAAARAPARASSRAASASASRSAAPSCAGRRLPARRAAVQPRRRAARLDPRGARGAARAARRRR